MAWELLQGEKVCIVIRLALSQVRFYLLPKVTDFVSLPEAFVNTLQGVFLTNPRRNIHPYHHNGIAISAP